MPLQRLSHAAADASLEQESGSPKVVRTYRWTEFAGKENTTEFDESHFQLEGHFESNSSQGHKEFQDRMRVIHFRKEGKSKADIARMLGRSEKFVAKWWQKDEKMIPRPWGVHEYLSKELGQKTSNTPAKVNGDTSASTAAWWRDVEVRRGYCKDPAIYEELLHNTEWSCGVARTRDFSTGASHLKYDKQGKTKLQSNQSAKYRHGQSPAMDKLLQKFFAEYGIVDRTSGIGLNWYPDGGAALGSHRHDCWTALFSFGYERILTIDKTPLLCQDGDVVIFGTQRHGVPFMPDISEGRITVPIFFYPDHLQMQKQWQTVTDPEDPKISRNFAKLEHEHSLGMEAANDAFWQDPEKNASIDALLQLGFETHDARAALIACNFDADRAVETLLLSGAGVSIEALGSFSAESSCQAGACCQGLLNDHKAIDLAPMAGEHQVGIVARWRTKNSAASPAIHGPTDGCCDSHTDHLVLPAQGSDDQDTAFALQLQLEESELNDNFGQHAIGSDLCHDEDSAAALAAHLEEEERAAEGNVLVGSGLLQAQFEEYEDQFKRDDAEEWHGHGDLMQRSLARETLTLQSMDKTTSYSVGHGRISEKDFYEVLSLNQVRVIYDFRASDYRGDVHAPCVRFSVQTLKRTCKARGLFYKHVALGRESAYGILPHISSDEAQHALIELAWHAKRGRAAFLGFEEDWRLDHRQVIAEELVRAGHNVKHILGNGETEDHPKAWKFPDFIMKEEEHLRKIEKMRQAGELKRPEKSAVDRSTEAIVSRLDRPADVVDAMDEMRNAANQVELVQVQRKLARVQRIAEKKSLLANKVLTNTPQWILEEAKQQEVWIAQKKAEKTTAAKRAEVEASQKGPTASEQPSGEETLKVECALCGQTYAWAELVERDGSCAKCAGPVASGSVAADIVSSTQVENDEAAESLLVECSKCSTLTPWQILQFGDGACPGCCRQVGDSYASLAAVAVPSECVSSSSCDAATATAMSSEHVSSGTCDAAALESIAVVQGCSSGARLDRSGSSWRAKRRAVAASS